MKISKPGIYDLPMDVYHSDCAAGPSLGGSGAVTLIDRCPALFWYESYLNPDRPVEEPDNARDFGSALHAMVLEPDQVDKTVKVCQFDDWRTKAAQEQRAQARDAGMTPVTLVQAVKLAAIVKAIHEHPLAGKAFTGGIAERSLFYRDEATGIWCKTRPDYLVSEGRYQIVQFKTAPSAKPAAFERHAHEMGYMQRAAWEIETVAEALGLKRMPEYRFVVVEREPPFLTSVCDLSDHAVEIGMMKNAAARHIFAECIETGRWPDYGSSAHTITIPSYGEFQFEERRVAGDFDITSRVKKLAFEAQAPL